MKLAVIPARGGSKRIPRKNIAMFAGKPMIAWSIEAAQKSGCFDAVIVSTDDEEIAGVARGFGAETPFVRPPELSDDYAPTVPVIRHAVQWWQKNRGQPDYACCIYATAPFVQAADLKKGLEALRAADNPYAISVTSFPFPVQRAVKINNRGALEMFQPEHMVTRSQDLESAYHDAGQFYWGRTDAWLAGKPFFENALPVVLPRFRVQDIDTMEDWQRAESIFMNLDKVA